MLFRSRAKPVPLDLFPVVFNQRLGHKIKLMGLSHVSKDCKKIKSELIRIGLCSLHIFLDV